MAIILDGKIVRDKKKAELKARISSFAEKQSPKTLFNRASFCVVVPRLAIIQVGDLPESNTYIAQKEKFGMEIGASVSRVRLAETSSTEEVVATISRLNEDPSVHGIIVQLPLPAGFNRETILAAVDPKKDVDGLGPVSTKKLENGEKGFIPATAKGVLSLLDHYAIPVAGKRVVVIGRSGLVGRPIALALLARKADVVVCHSQTPDIAAETKQADVIIVAVGKPKLIGPQHISSDPTRKPVIVDVGINLVVSNTLQKLEDEVPEAPKARLVGDVGFAAVEPLVAAISPVPGGVGPLTVASLFENLLDALDGVL